MKRPLRPRRGPFDRAVPRERGLRGPYRRVQPEFAQLPAPRPPEVRPGAARVEAAVGGRQSPDMAEAAFDTQAVTRQLKAKGLADLQSEIRSEMAEIRTDLRWTKAIGGVIVALLIGILWVLLDTGG